MLDSCESALLVNHPMLKRAYDFYADWPENPFFRYVGMHQFNGGYMFWDDTYFIIGRPVWVNPDDPKSSRKFVTNPEHRYDPEKCNCWFIWLYAGNVKRAFTNFPYWLPYFGYERRGNFHITNIDKTMLKLTGKDTLDGKPRKTKRTEEA